MVQRASGIEAWDAATGPASGKVLGISAEWAVSELLDMLRDRDPDRRLFAALALAQYDLENDRTLPALIVAARDEDPRVRVAVMSALYWKVESDPPAVRDRVIPVWFRALSDGHPHVRGAAAHFLQLHGRVKEVVPVLVELLRYQDTLRGTLWELQALGPSAAAAVPAVLQVLDEKPLAAADRWRRFPTPAERIDAASTLLRLGEVEVGRSILERYSTDEDELLRTWAREQLESYRAETSEAAQVPAAPQ
jgi:hypothetical protein